MSNIYDKETFDPAKGIGRYIGRVKIKMTEALDQELEQYDITAAQYVVLVSLATGTADSAATLCRCISYDPGAMTRMLDRLERRGLIRRVPNPNDRRAINLELTDEGKAIYPKLKHASMTIGNKFLTGFSQDEVKQLEGFLQRMIDNA
jgi:DNA-binding MarR family transcriptional regulator